MTRSLRLASFLVLAMLAAACSSLRYDLGEVPFPISASPLRGASDPSDRFVLQGKHVLWVHGLLGEDQPDIQGQLLANLIPCVGVADFRVTSAATFHDWLLTHLSLGLVRMKTVTVTGTRIRAPR